MPPKSKNHPKKQDKEKPAKSLDQGGHKGTKGAFDMNQILSGNNEKKK